jgi:hypothetical protein
MQRGQSFERWTAGELARLGWNAETTKATGDWGADVVAEIANEILVVQCKDWTSPVGLTAIHEIHYARIHYAAHIAAVVSRAGYTRAAKVAAGKVGVHLLTADMLHTGCVLDRTEKYARMMEERRLRREQEDQRRRENWAAFEWQNYDTDARRHRQTKVAFDTACRVIARLTPFCLTILAGLAIDSTTDAQVLAAGFGLTLSLRVLGYYVEYCPPRLRQPPEGNRKLAVRACRYCSTKLRLEVGRIGFVRCPQCWSRSRFSTMAVNPVEIDAPFNP